MEYAYRYGYAQSLYLNVTNHCTNRCSFCVRYRVDGLGGSVLWGKEEPDLEMLQRAVLGYGELNTFREFIWCGYGEPTFRLDLILQAASWLRSHGARIRLNTNGHACLIHGRDVLSDLSRAVDEISISMNAPDCRQYLELCRPGLDLPGVAPGKFWDAMIDCLARAPLCFESTQASVVGAALSRDAIDQCKALAKSFGIRKFRVR
jgi:TatD DNase family protein